MNQETEGLRRSERNRKYKAGSQNPPPPERHVGRTIDFADEAVIVPAPLVGLGPLLPRPEDMAGRGSTRLKYRKFKADGREDVDDWLCEFNSTAAANEDDVQTKLRMFQGLLKGEALHWYQDVSPQIRNDWEQLTGIFLQTFREVGGDARTLGKLSRMHMKSNESVRRYGQRVRSLIHRLTPGIAASVQIEWYVSGFPKEMAFHVRQARPPTLQEAMEAAQNYENSMQSLHQTRRSSKATSSRRDRKSRSRRKEETSDSSDPSSGSNTGSSSGHSSERGDCSPPRRNPGLKDTRRNRDRGTVKIKEEVPDEGRMIKEIQSSLAAIKVQLADSNKPRRAAPVTRSHVWCIRCGKSGHYPNECPFVPPGMVMYVDVEGSPYFEYDQEEEETVPTYQVYSTYGRGRGVVPQTKPRYAPGRPESSADPQGLGYKRTVSFERMHGLCFLCGKPGHYAPDCPDKGAPLELPCQNCGHYGHTAPQCQQPVKPRVIYKPVDVPPRDQTALNYGHSAGVEKPPN